MLCVPISCMCRLFIVRAALTCVRGKIFVVRGMISYEPAPSAGHCIAKLNCMLVVFVEEAYFVMEYVHWLQILG